MQGVNNIRAFGEPNDSEQQKEKSSPLSKKLNEGIFGLKATIKTLASMSG